MKEIKALVEAAMVSLLPEKPKEPPSKVSETVTVTFCCYQCRDEQQRQCPGVFYQEGESRSYLCKTCEHSDRVEMFSSYCPPLYRENDLARLPARQYRQAMEWQFSSKGLLLMGDSGTGKTRVAWALLRRILIEDSKRYSFAWFDCVSFGHSISKRYREDTAEEWLEEMSQKYILFFDDLGKLKLTERAEAELFGLIERRCANQLPIIATTNDTGDSLASRMTDNRGPAMIRRLREFCDVIAF